MYLVRTESELAEHAQHGRCVAISEPPDNSEIPSPDDKDDFSEGFTIGEIVPSDYPVD